MNSKNNPNDSSPSRTDYLHSKTRERVGFWERCAFGSGFLPIFFGNAAVKSFAIPVYQMTLGLNPVVFGLVMALPRFWDAITDPLMGYVSDNLQTRWGRRRPLIVIGGVLQAVAFGLIWMVPSGLSEGWIIAYLSISLIIFYSCHTIFSVPFISLGYEMTPDYEERNKVHAYGVLFGKIGEFTYQWIFPITQLAIFGSVLIGIRIVGWTVGILIMGLVAIIPGLFVKERYYQQAKKQTKIPLWGSMLATFKNQAFLVLVGMAVFQIVAGIMASSIDYYLLVYHLCDGNIAEGSVWKAILSMGYALVGVASIYPINKLANRVGKEKSLNIVFSLLFFGAIAKWWIYHPGDGGVVFRWIDSSLDKIPWLATNGNHWKILIDPILCGPVWIAINIITPSMFADICDDDEMKHGNRREGMFGAVFSWIQKTGYSLSFFGTGLALTFAGFNEKLGGLQAAGTFFSLRIYLSISTLLWAVITILLLKYYPLTRERVYEIREILESRRGQL